MDKKALSPLITTVILVAVGVAIGSIILALTTGLGECRTVKLGINMVDNKPRACYNAELKQIEIEIENGAKSEIAAFKLTLEGSRDIQNTDFEKTFGKSETKKIAIPYDLNKLGSILKVKLSPVILSKEGKQVICPVEKAIVVEKIPDCEW